MYKREVCQFRFSDTRSHGYCLFYATDHHKNTTNQYILCTIVIYNKPYRLSRMIMRPYKNNEIINFQRRSIRTFSQFSVKVYHRVMFPYTYIIFLTVCVGFPALFQGNLLFRWIIAGERVKKNGFSRETFRSLWWILRRYWGINRNFWYLKLKFVTISVMLINAEKRVTILFDNNYCFEKRSQHWWSRPHTSSQKQLVYREISIEICHPYLSVFQLNILYFDFVTTFMCNVYAFVCIKTDQIFSSKLSCIR